MHDKVRIEAVQVKRNDPVVHAENRFLDIRTFVLLFLDRCLLWRNYDLVLEKFIVNDRVPSTNLAEYIVVVYLGRVCHGKNKFNQLHLALKLID